MKDRAGDPDRDACTGGTTFDDSIFVFKGPSGTIERSNGQGFEPHFYAVTFKRRV